MPSRRRSPFYFGLELVTAERVLDLLHDPVHRLGLVDKPIGAEADGLDATVVAAGARVDDHRNSDGMFGQ